VVVARRPGTTVTVIETASKDRAEEVTGTVPGTLITTTTVPVETTILPGTTVPETTAPVVTAPPVVVTQPPVVVTQPPVVTTQAPTTTLPAPVVTVPQKPAPQVIGTGGLNPDEQVLLGEIQAFRAGQGRGGLSVENTLQQVATAKDSQWIAVGSPVGISFNEVNVQLTGLSAVYGKGLPSTGIAGLWANIQNQYGGVVAGPYTYVGISVQRDGAGWYYATIALGA
jgi:hypothetical protein